MSVLVFNVDPHGGPASIKVRVGASASTAPQIVRCKCIDIVSVVNIPPTLVGTAEVTFEVNPSENAFFAITTQIVSGDASTRVQHFVEQSGNQKSKLFDTRLFQNAFRSCSAGVQFK